ncbi:hypothetical protein, partial [Butyricimonas sp. BSD2780061689_150309_C8]|uniref:hypothetical protein n=1 Tax=Butyricimonas sp. BSD2780061689_150309_C8 TaxID=2787088 RepID=UPI001E4D3E47
KWVSFGYKGGSGDFYNSGSSDFIFSIVLNFFCSKLVGEEPSSDTQIAEERRNLFSLPDFLRELSVTH